MEHKRYCDGHWFLDRKLGAIRHLRGGWYEEGAYPTEDAYDYTLREHDIYSLVQFLEQEGYIKPRLDERLRTEDLKITHRLLDLLEKHP